MSTDPITAFEMFTQDLRAYDLFGCSYVDYITKPLTTGYSA